MTANERAMRVVAEQARARQAADAISEREDQMIDTPATRAALELAELPK